MNILWKVMGVFAVYSGLFALVVVVGARVFAIQAWAYLGAYIVAGVLMFRKNKIGAAMYLVGSVYLLFTSRTPFFLNFLGIAMVVGAIVLLLDNGGKIKNS